MEDSVGIANGLLKKHAGAYQVILNWLQNAVMEELVDAVIAPSVATPKSQIDEPVVADLALEVWLSRVVLAKI